LTRSAAEDEILATLAEFHAVEKAGDVDKMLMSYSDDFTNSLGGTKPMLRGFLDTLAAQGVLQSISADMEKCEIVVAGDNATIAPVLYTSSLGPSTYVYKMRKEADGEWRFINAEQI
jgi:ketosteroid isomerase-like protein